jgi:DNA-directed RNA polymerase sigma subunit (sigma70/sigma32)
MWSFDDTTPEAAVLENGNQQEKSDEKFRRLKAAVDNLDNPLDHPILDKEEEGFLITQYKRGNEEAKTLLIQYNLKIINKVALNYINDITNLTVSDLISFGIIGLNRAIEKFDLSRDNTLNSYAYGWIQATISRAIQKYDKSVNIPSRDFSSGLNVYMKY